MNSWDQSNIFSKVTGDRTEKSKGDDMKFLVGVSEVRSNQIQSCAWERGSSCY